VHQIIYMMILNSALITYLSFGSPKIYLVGLIILSKLTLLINLVSLKASELRGLSLDLFIVIPVEP
jgi:hypothetical protein